MKSAEELYDNVKPLIENGWDDAAICALVKVVESYPDFANAHNDIGLLCHKIGKKDNVLPHFQKAVKIEPDNPNFQKNLADFYYTELNQPEEALISYKKVLEFDQKNTNIMFIAGNLCVVLNKYAEAKFLYENILEIEPFHVEAKEYVEKLEKHIQKEKQVKSPDEIYNICQDMINAGDKEKAIIQLEELVSLHPGYSRAHNDLGVLFLQKEKNDNALKHFIKALELQPNNIIFKKNLAELYYFQLKDVENALKLYLSILQNNPEDIEALMVAGHINYALKRFEDAELFYKKVLDIEPWNLEADKCLSIVLQNSLQKVSISQ